MKKNLFVIVLACLSLMASADVDFTIPLYVPKGSTFISSKSMTW